jgi:hypothetical protein
VPKKSSPNEINPAMGTWRSIVLSLRRESKFGFVENTSVESVLQEKEHEL